VTFAVLHRGHVSGKIATGCYRHRAARNFSLKLRQFDP
jgi:hypothetical protein